MEDQEYSSGCESGWTLYLEQSFISPYQTPSPRGNNNAHFLGKSCGGFKNTEDEEEEEEEEDLSMVSDASSGPPHFREDEEFHNSNDVTHFCPTEKHVIDTTLLSNKSWKKQKTRENRRRKPQEMTSFLDDTASSPFFNFSNKNVTLSNSQASMEDMVDFSQGYSTTTTHFERKSTFQDQFGYYHSPVSGSQLQHNQWFEEKRMGMR